jgi:flagellar protein FlaF
LTTLNMARSAYARPEAPARAPRSIEYELLSRATQRMTTAWPKRRGEFAALASALDQNLQLWSTLGADVADPDNGLPANLRARLFYLYQFTAEHTRSVLEGRGSVEVLVDINTAVMRGLRGEGTAI